MPRMSDEPLPDPVGVLVCTHGDVELYRLSPCVSGVLRMFERGVEEPEFARVCVWVPRTASLPLISAFRGPPASR